MTPFLVSAFLVEDEQAIRDTLVEAMEEIAPLNFVGVADSEKTASDWLTAHPDDWDLVIVDLFLAQGSGFGVLRRCKDRPARQKMVVLTGYTQAHLVERCLEVGANAVFDKSKDIEELVEFCKKHARELAANPRASQNLSAS